MPERLVIGIISNCEPSRVEQALAAAGVDRAGVKVLTTQASTPQHINSSVSFVHVAETLNRDSMADAMTRHTGVIPDFGGTAVPGINDAGRSLGAFSHPEVLDYLGDSRVPGGAAEEYNDAIADGRCVVVYTCEADRAPAAQTALQGAGLSEVRLF